MFSRSERHQTRLATGSLRVAIVTETFLPVMNGVTNSAIRVIEHLKAQGHEPVVIAPGPGETSYKGTPVVRVKSFEMPRYGDFRVALPPARLTALLRTINPDVVHLAAPAVLGGFAGRAAKRLGIPTVAIFQTDIAGFARRHGFTLAGTGIWRFLRWAHAPADITLAPSTSTVFALRSRGLDNVKLWARGVDLERYHASKRCASLRSSVAPNGEVIVGYIGRLAREKQVGRLAPILDNPKCRLVIVGDGPDRKKLEHELPGAYFAGFQTGEALARWHASLDVFVHTGLDETFCQALQESMASGVAGVAPSSGGPLDLVKHGTTGYFWSPESPETLEGAVSELADRPALRDALGHAGRREAEQRPWNVILDRLLEHYRSVALDQPVRRRRSLFTGRVA